jgi:DNA-binding transcriptional MocR family regulator
VRQAGISRKISPSTVFGAYYLLEARGLIHARPRSGYYVSETAVRAENEPRTSAPRKRTSAVEISELVFRVLGSVKDRTVVPLGSAFPGPDLFPLERLSRSLAAGMRKLEPVRIVDDLPPGNERLRRQIALRYTMHGVDVAIDEVVVTSGALEALNLCLQAVTRPGDVVLVESPTFYGALQAIERLNLKAVEVATHPRAGVDLDALEAALRRHPVKACWLMPNFQNPLGSLMSDDHKRRLVALLSAHDVPLIEDDVYAELYFGVQRPQPAKAFDTKGLVLHCSSFSKCLAPGYRVGWVAAGRYAQRIERLKLMTTLSAAIPSQQALAEYLDSSAYERHLRRLRRTLETRRDAVLHAIARHFPAGTRMTRPEGGYFVWLALPEGTDALRLHEHALDRRISVAPGHLFSVDRRFANFVRLNYGHPADARALAAVRTLGQLAAAESR